jgi:hypothetical protein
MSRNERRGLVSESAIFLVKKKNHLQSCAKSVNGSGLLSISIYTEMTHIQSVCPRLICGYGGVALKLRGEFVTSKPLCLPRLAFLDVAKACRGCQSSCLVGDDVLWPSLDPLLRVSETQSLTRGLGC